MSSEVPARSHHNFWLGLFLAIGLIISTLIVSGTVSQVKLANQTITVKGYAEKRIRSDLIVWRGNFTARSAQIKEAYRILAADLVKVKEYLSSKGVAPDEVTVTSIETRTLYRRDEQGRPTDEVSGYELLQGVEITSVEVDKVTTIARKSTELIEKGVLFHSRPPQYLYTRLSDVKIEMVAEATKDARERAQQLAVNSGSKIGTLRSATMGVFQITRAHSTEISGYGMYDTSSLEKDIKAVVTVSFSID